jgi:hypothetical protein
MELRDLLVGRVLVWLAAKLAGEGRRREPTPVAPEPGGLVLLIEPHRELRIELLEYLTRSGFVVVPAADEASGLVLASRLDVRVVIVAVSVLDDATAARLQASFGGSGRRARSLFVVAEQAPSRAGRLRNRDVTVLPRPLDVCALKRVLARALRPRGARPRGAAARRHRGRPPGET